MEKVFEIISKPISEYLKKYGIYLSDEIILIFLIVMGIVLPILITKAYKYLVSSVNHYSTNINLHPFFDFKEVKNVKKNYITQKFQNIAPSKEDELVYTNSYVAKQNLIDFLFKSFSNKSEKRFFIILADSGMGKTTFSLNLYLKYNSLFRQLFKRNKFKIALIPLGYDDVDTYIDKLKIDDRHLNTILVLDAFDEDKKAIVNNVTRLNEIIELTKDFRFLIITCRTQFFNNEKLEPNEINVPRYGTKKGYYSFEKLYLSPFSDNDVKKFIFKKYGIINLFSKEKKKAYKIIQKSPYLMARPMLLDFIKDLTKTNKEYDFTFEIYESLIDAWLDRETLNVNPNKKFTYKNELLKFSSEISKVIYLNRSQSGYTINMTEFEKIAIKNNLDLTFFEMKTRSLLNRNSIGDYKFSHKSILEYFLALQIYKNYDFKKNFDEEGMDMTINFYNELCYSNDFINYNYTEKYLYQIKAFYKNNLAPKIMEFEKCLDVTKLHVSNFNEENIRCLRAFKNITELVIKDSTIVSLEDINCFQNLKELSIIDCKVDEIDRISELKYIEKLTLQKINFHDFQKNNIKWRNFQNVSEINLSLNKLTNFNQINDMKYLKYIDLSGNNISSFNIPPYLNTLNISNNKLTSLRIQNINLNKLDASYNQMKSFSISKNHFLLSLNLSNNNIDEMSIEDNTILNTLNVSNNLLNDHSVSQVLFFQNLEDLNISSNKIKDVKFIKNLDKLEIINLEGNKIGKINYEMIPDNLEKIIISNVELDDKMGNSFKFENDSNSWIRNK